MKNKNALLIAGTVALADSAVKGYFDEPPVKNYGFAGNLLDKDPKVVACVSGALTAVMAVALLAAPEKLKLPMALILGGAISNTADRLIRGYVVDYIPMGTLGSGKKKRPKRAYYGNISDFAILTGTVTGLAGYLSSQSGERTKISAPGPDPVPEGQIL